MDHISKLLLVLYNIAANNDAEIDRIAGKIQGRFIKNDLLLNLSQLDSVSLKKEVLYVIQGFSNCAQARDLEYLILRENKIFDVLNGVLQPYEINAIPNLVQVYLNTCKFLFHKLTSKNKETTKLPEPLQEKFEYFCGMTIMEHI